MSEHIHIYVSVELWYVIDVLLAVMNMDATKPHVKVALTPSQKISKNVRNVMMCIVKITDVVVFLNKLK